jgi:hypothetical protein
MVMGWVKQGISSPLKSFSNRAIFSGSRPQETMVAPRRPKRTLVAKPMPPAPPETSTTRSRKRSSRNTVGSAATSSAVRLA